MVPAATGMQDQSGEHPHSLIIAVILSVLTSAFTATVHWHLHSSQPPQCQLYQVLAR